MKTKIPTSNKITYLILLVIISVFLFFVVRAFSGNFTFPEQIPLGPFSLRFYGLILLIAILMSVFAFERLLNFYKKRNKDKSIDKFDIYEALIWAIIPGVVFARVVYYLSFINEYYGGDFSDVYKIWEGGMSIFGALTGGIAGLIFYLKKNKLKLFPFLDIAFIVFPLGHAIGRWANFINQEIFGPPTNLPWKMYISPENRIGIPAGFQKESFFHPLFLYEFVWNIILFGFLLWLFKKQPKRFGGFFASIYLICYGLIRFVIEFMRFDPKLSIGISVAQILSLIMILLGVLYLVYNKKARKDLPDDT